MIELREPAPFIYAEVNEPVVVYSVPGVRSSVDGRIEIFARPRRFIYIRTTAEPVLGLYEYELLGEEK